jgi:hypothetical protein
MLKNIVKLHKIHQYHLSDTIAINSRYKGLLWTDTR